MPKYHAPSVNPEEEPNGSKPIQGVSTGTAGLVGPTSMGPASGRPPVLTCFADFERIYGSLEPLRFGGELIPNYIAYAARAFFAEGGKRLYVSRILHDTDGNLPLARAYRGSSAELTGLAALESVDEISVVAAPGSTTNYSGENRGRADGITDALVEHAERMRYRVAVLDAPDGQSSEEIVSYRLRLDSAYAALYYPWVKAVALNSLPVYPNLREGHSRLNLPPSGFMAGVYARNDVQRGVFQAPSNLGLRSVVGLEISLAKDQLELLNEKGINCLRIFPHRGVWVWGRRTLSLDPEWKYVNIRRYLAYLENSIEQGTQWAVFEPNGEDLWANVRQAVGDFLFNEWKSGALRGSQPDQAYFVRCDRSTMTQNDLDNGRLVCLIGVAIVKPAEFVIFRLGQWTADRRG